VAISGCNPSGAIRTPAERELLRVWSSPTASVDERAAAADRCFTNGTPVSSVIALLGTNHSTFSLVALVNPGVNEKMMELIYDFGGESVTINLMAPMDTDALHSRYSGAVSSTWLRRLRDGQPGGAANGSQPIRSETNPTSGAAGSRR